ncbi:MAG: S8 family serine peptidase [Firmicutes bacterium]|jgi:subtilisin family serine protease|nr:S8 family serine peptidase [Bacillota bacterium]
MNRVLRPTVAAGMIVLMLVVGSGTGHGVGFVARPEGLGELLPQVILAGPKAQSGTHAATIPDMGLVEDMCLGGAGEPVPGEYIVRLKAGATAERVLRLTSVGTGVKARGIDFRGTRRFPSGLTLFHVEVGPGIPAEEFLAALEACEDVVYVAPNRRVGVCRDPVIPDDPLFGYQWALRNTGQTFFPGIWGKPGADIRATEGWAISADAGEVVVACLDTGIWIDHPDLAANIWVNQGEILGNGVDDDGNGYVDDVWGWDFYHGDNSVYDPLDREGHGTHVAGILGAVSDNLAGVAGVAWKVRIMPLKFLGPRGGTTAGAIEALAYACNNGAHITTNSWGYVGPPDPALADAMAAAGMLHICASGNRGVDNDAGYPGNTHYPSSFPLPNIIAVAASDWDDALADFSCWGPSTVDLAAPGAYILSTFPSELVPAGFDPYAFMSGTSMAAPHVAGAAAVLLAQHPNIPHYPGQPGNESGSPTIRDLLLATVDKKTSWESAVSSGGRLNLRNALLGAVPPVVGSISASPVYGEPPLPVALTGEVRNAGNIVDVWWDPGDGTPPVHAMSTLHTYEKVGAYRASFHVLDDRGLESVEWVSVAVANPKTVILVDDDGSGGDQAFADSLDSIGIEWIRLDAPLAIPAEIPNPVIWTTGAAWDRTLTHEDQEWIGRFFDAGGGLFLSGQDILWDLGPASRFARERLHVAEWRDDVGVHRVRGVASDPITAGIDIELQYGHPDLSDAITPGEGASGILQNQNSEICALRYSSTPGHRLIFTAFPFETIPPGEVRDGLMDRIIAFLCESGLPSVQVSPEGFDVCLHQGSLARDTLVLTNSGDATLSFTVHSGRPGTAGAQAVGTATGMAGAPAVAEIAAVTSAARVAAGPASIAPLAAGGPDGYGYVWRDNDDPDGPEFAWVDITGAGRQVGFWDPDDGWAVVDLPFEFPFYGERKTEVSISANGYLTFGPAQGVSGNHPIPDQRNPNDLIAVFWDDLDMWFGSVYCHHDEEGGRFIVSWISATTWHSGGVLTFQVILSPDGRITYQYLTADTRVDRATVGIEDGSGTRGLEVAYRSNYVRAGLAVEFVFEPEWLRFDPSFGAVGPGSEAHVGVIFDARRTEPGTYRKTIAVMTNDPESPQLLLPAVLTVIPNEPPVIVRAAADPLKGPHPLTVKFEAEAWDPDGSVTRAWWDFGDGEAECPEPNTTHTYTSPGIYWATFHAVDDVGAEAEARVRIDSLAVAGVAVSPDRINVSVPPGKTAESTLVLENPGTQTLGFIVAAAEEVAPYFLKAGRSVGQDGPWGSLDRDAVTALASGRGVEWVFPGRAKTEQGAAREAPTPTGAGDTLVAWPASGVGLAWGAGFDGERVWVSDASVFGEGRDVAYSQAGQALGIEFPTPWAGGWPADFAWDGSWLWQVAVGGTNGIYALDPETGAMMAEIHDPAGIWDANSQRGLAYDRWDDAFYIGGWWDGAVYKIAGTTWPEPGAILGSYDLDLPIAGLAKLGWYLVITLNSDPDVVAVLDSITGEIVAAFLHPGGGAYGAGGCEADGRGNIWVTYQGDYYTGANHNQVYLVDFGSIFGDLPEWLGVSVREGTVPPGCSATLGIDLDAAGMAAGETKAAQIAILTNAADAPVVLVPVTLRAENALPVVEITSPRAGERLMGTCEIMWNAANPGADPADLVIYIEYSGDAGQSWKPVASGLPNTGRFVWDTRTVGRGGRYVVRVTAEDTAGGRGEATSGEFTIVAPGSSVAAAPNPSHDSVVFFYSLEHEGTLRVYSISGMLVHSAKVGPGDGAHEWNLLFRGMPLASGLYLYLVVAEDGDRTDMGRLVISR